MLLFPMAPSFYFAVANPTLRCPTVSLLNFQPYPSRLLDTNTPNNCPCCRCLAIVSLQWLAKHFVYSFPYPNHKLLSSILTAGLESTFFFSNCLRVGRLSTHCSSKIQYKLHKKDKWQNQKFSVFWFEWWIFNIFCSLFLKEKWHGTSRKSWTWNA